MAIVLVVAVSLIFGGCSSSTSNTNEEEPQKPADGQSLPENSTTENDNTSVILPDVEVDIVNFTFSPAEIIIPIGTTVIWRNSDSALHTVTSDDGIFDSGSLSRGNTFSYTFEKAGTYPYYCVIHPYMKATVIVE